MNTAPLSHSLTSTDDAALARSLADRVAAEAGLGWVERLEFVSTLSAHMREALAKDGPWRLDIGIASGEEPRLRATLSPQGADETGTAVWEATADIDPPALGRLPRFVSSGHEDRTRLRIAEALLEADADIGALVELLHAEQKRVEWHRNELEDTNRGVLALHAELDAANEAQGRHLDAEHRARAAAEASGNRLTFLSAASAALADSLNHEEVLGRLTELLVPDHARTAQVWLLDSQERLDHAVGVSKERTLDPHGRRAATQAIATKRAQHAAAHPSGLEGLDGLDDILIESGAQESAEPVLAIPLIARSASLGVLIMTRADGDLDRDDAVMLIEFARRAATAADNALRYERERDIAETLQRAMLTDLPTRADVRLAARYLPATSGMNVGGDWYDVFLQPDDSLIGVIGDVTGHGIQAAVMMGQLRNALRAYAVEGHGPGGLLTRLHNLLCHLEPDLFASAVIAQIRPGDPTVAWASAGHLPPLLREPDGRVRILQPLPDAMLGLPLDQTVADHELTLAPGSTLLLYTDGLVERRSHGVDPGIDRLADVLSRLGPVLEHDPDTAADMILEEMLRDSPGEDDVCLLVCHADAAGSAPRAFDDHGVPTGTSIALTQGSSSSSV